MTKEQQNWVLASSARVYRCLLKILPTEFGKRFGDEIAQSFEDLCDDTFDRAGVPGLVAVWPSAIRDLAVSALSEYFDSWRDHMRKAHLITITLGSLLLIYSALFAAINILQYNLGFTNIWNPFQVIVDSPRPTLITQLLNALIIVGPALAVVLYLLPFVRIKVDWHGEQMVLISINRANRLIWVLLGICLLVGAIFLVYATVENLPCLLASATSC
jgi:hypothetical protein